MAERAKQDLPPLGKVEECTVRVRPHELIPRGMIGSAERAHTRFCAPVHDA